MKPLWIPAHPETSQMWHFMQYVAEKHGIALKNYNDLHTWSIHHLADFWQAIYQFFKIDFDKPATEILNEYCRMMDARWFTGAYFNYAKILLKRRDAHPAIISITESDDRHVLTYADLYHEVSRCSAGLRALGVGPGSRVAGVMPNTAFTLIAMLASASVGAIWSTCSPDFGIEAILDRFTQIQPSIVFMCNGHRYHGKEHQAAPKIQALATALQGITQVVIYPHLKTESSLTYTAPNIMTLDAFLKPAGDITFESLPFEHPLYILFSSGTTGKPKCIMHGAGGTLLQHIKELGLHTDIRPQDNLLFYTTCGWMMWNWMASTLALGATLTLYEGSPTYPTPMRLLKITEKERITHLGLGAKLLSTLEKEGVKPKSFYALPSLRTILSTGSVLLAHQYTYVYTEIKADVQLSSISGGTDIVSCFALGNPLLPVYSGELQCIGLGMDVAVYDEMGQAIKEKPGELVCIKPFPSMPIGFWQDPDKHRYTQAYFERFPEIWTHGDFAAISKHHGLIIYGRSDATLNPGGVRIGTAELYRQLETITEIVDSVAIDQRHGDDTRIVLFVKLRPRIKLDEGLKTTIRQTIRQNTSPRHVPSLIIQVPDIPRTHNGKLVEIAVRQVVHGETVKNTDALANPESLAYFHNCLELL